MVEPRRGLPREVRAHFTAFRAERNLLTPLFYRWQLAALRMQEKQRPVSLLHAAPCTAYEAQLHTADVAPEDRRYSGDSTCAAPTVV